MEHIPLLLRCLQLHRRYSGDGAVEIVFATPASLQWEEDVLAVHKTNLVAGMLRTRPNLFEIRSVSSTSVICGV